MGVRARSARVLEGISLVVLFMLAQITVPLFASPATFPLTGNLTVPYDDLLSGVADLVPTFGGVAGKTDGKLNIWIVGGSSTAASSVHEELIKLRPVSFTAQGFNVLEASYSFADLYRWRALITNELLGKDEGVVASSIADDRNLLRVGVSNVSQQEAGVRQKIEALGIPWAAVFLDEGAGPVKFESSLQGWHRPLVGGLKITSFSPAAGGLPCSLGFTATRQGFNGFVTASHCGTPNVCWMATVTLNRAAKAMRLGGR